LKRKIIFIVCSILFLTGCRNTTSIESSERKIFDTENKISSITIHTTINGTRDISVPEDALDEIISWLNTFEVGDPVGDTVIPGTGSTSVTLTYVDGSTVTQKISIIKIDGTSYYIEAPDAPVVWVSLINS